jgi:purine-binding chemotaxis protein CheW
VSGGLADRAAALRARFDRSFAEPPRGAAAATEDLLAIRLGGAPYALRLAELAGLFADRKVAPLPSAVRELLGVAGFRGAIVPVYDLRLLLGCTATAPPRWLVIAAQLPVGFGFDVLEGHLRVSADAIATGDGGGALVHTPEPRSIVALAAVLAAIARRAGTAHLPQEG